MLAHSERIERGNDEYMSDARFALMLLECTPQLNNTGDVCQVATLTNLTIFDSGMCYVGTLKHRSRMTDFFAVKQEHIHSSEHTSKHISAVK